MQIVIDLSSSIKLAGRVYFCIDIREWPVCHADLEHILHLEWLDYTIFQMHMHPDLAPVWSSERPFVVEGQMGQGLLIQSTTIVLPYDHSQTDIKHDHPSQDQRLLPPMLR